jgi:hypothetical protein
MHGLYLKKDFSIRSSWNLNIKFSCRMAPVHLLESGTVLPALKYQLLCRSHTPKTLASNRLFKQEQQRSREQSALKHVTEIQGWYSNPRLMGFVLIVSEAGFFTHAASCMPCLSSSIASVSLGYPTILWCRWNIPVYKSHRHGEKLKFM